MNHLRDEAQRGYNQFESPISAGQKRIHWVAAAVTALAGATAYSGVTAASSQKKAAKAAQAAADKQIQANKDAAAKLQAEEATAAQQAQAQITERRKRILAGSKSVYTTPLGVGSSAAVARKTLLGQ